MAVHEDTSVWRTSSLTSSACHHEVVQRTLSVELKPNGTPVTNADAEVEEAIRAAISDERPDDDVIGEEGDAGEQRRR